jgi:hypothetical protein
LLLRRRVLGLGRSILLLDRLLVLGLVGLLVLGLVWLLVLGLVRLLVLRLILGVLGLGRSGTAQDPAYGQRDNRTRNGFGDHWMSLRSSRYRCCGVLVASVIPAACW